MFTLNERSQTLWIGSIGIGNNATQIIIICDQILENSSKSHMKSSVFLHVFNNISAYVYVFTAFSAQITKNVRNTQGISYIFGNLSTEFHVVL